MYRQDGQSGFSFKAKRHQKRGEKIYILLLRGKYT